MKQFILGKKVAYASGADANAVADGAIGIFYNKAGVFTACAKGDEFQKEAMLVCGRPAAKGGPIVIPIHKNKFSFVKGEYQAPVAFKATVTVVQPTQIGEYTIIVAKKGVGFNERNKWTASVYVSDISMTEENLAAALVKRINGNSAGSGVTASNAAGVITIVGSTAGVDYEIVTADNLINVVPAVTQKCKFAYGDADYIRALANEAAADMGFEYTYEEADRIYPGYPINPLAAADVADTGFTIFTLKFAEPRETKTIDTEINQIVQVAFPTGAAGIATFETVCKGIMGIVEAGAD